MTNDMDQSFFKTKDLYEAAFLQAIGKKLLRLEKDGYVFWFIFDDRKSCEEASNLYWQGDGMVSGKEYANQVRNLKDRIFAQR